MTAPQSPKADSTELLTILSDYVNDLRLVRKRDGLLPADAAVARLKQREQAARIAELRNLPWKRADRYGVNSPYVTKTWLTTRIAELTSNQDKTS